MDFDQSFQALSGTAQIEGSSAPIKDGKIDGKTISFTVGNGSSEAMSFTGEVNGGEITFTSAVSVVLGVGIFKTPQLVAANVESGWAFIGLWTLGGLITLVGALCYAELGSARPDAGGEYRYLRDAYGSRVGVMFAWARGTVIQTGTIAAVAFVFGDYASEMVCFGEHSSAIYAALAILSVTAVNLAGTPRTSWIQKVLTGLSVITLAAIVVAGLA